VIIYNEGQPGRTELLSGTLGDVIDIPVVGQHQGAERAVRCVAHATWTIAKSKTGVFEDQSLTARKKSKGVKTRMKGSDAKR
jgi:hypothetical protein